MRMLWWFRSPCVRCFSVNHVTCERARGARRLPPGNPGSRPGKSPLRGPFGLFPSAFGSGAILHPCRSPPLGASLRLAPACGQRLSDFQPDMGVAVGHLFFLRFFSAVILLVQVLCFVGPCKRSAAGRGRGAWVVEHVAVEVVPFTLRSLLLC